MALKLITPATDTPISLQEAKDHLRVNHTDDDALIALLIKSVTDYVEGPYGFLARALINQTWELTIDSFPTNEVKIPLPPLIEVVSIDYDDAGGMAQTLSNGLYYVDTVSEPGWVLPIAGGWPSTFDGINAVRIRYRAGYVDNSVSPAVGEVPFDIKAALLLYIGSLYEHRETVVIGQTATQLPWGAEALLRGKRIQLSMA